VLSEGQTWFFEGDNSTAISYLIVRKIETNEQGIEIVHVSIKDISIDGELWDIAHLPIEQNILAKSLKSRTEVDPEEDNLQEFEEAYSLWKKDNGGVWGIELKDVIKNTLINAGLQS